MLVSEVLSDVSHARSLRDDDSIVITDVRGSTRLGQLGKAREVNFVGAACISVVLNEFPNVSIPYVFGGDGATFVVGAEYRAKVLELLAQVRSMAIQQFGIDLRVGFVTLGELRMQGAELMVCQYTPRAGNLLSIHRKRFWLGRPFGQRALRQIDLSTTPDERAPQFEWVVVSAATLSVTPWSHRHCGD